MVSARKKLWGIFTAIIVTGLIVAACGGDDDPTAVPTTAPRATATTAPVAATAVPTVVAPKRGGKWVGRVSGSFFNEWNAYTARGQYAVVVIQNLLSNLTHLDAVDGSSIIPDLAESFSLSGDGKTVTFKIRQGVQWHDGQGFDASDVVYSINRGVNPSDPSASVFVNRLSLVDNAVAPDAQTVVVTLSEPSASLLTVMSAPGFLMYPAHIPDVDAWKANPIGTGPFEFVSLHPDTGAELTRNDYYYKVDENGESLPYMDAVETVRIGDQFTAFSAFRAGELSCACGYSSDILQSQVQTAKQMEGVQIGTAWSVNTLFFNSKPPFDNQKVRQAIHIGLDRVAFKEILRGGDALFPPTYYVPENLGGQWTLTREEFLSLPGFRTPKQLDTDRAAELFAEAGVDPSEMTINFVGNSVQTDINEALGSLLLQMGIGDVRVRALGSADRRQAMASGDFDISNTGGGRAMDDAADQLASYATTGGSQNYGKFSNATIDRLIGEQERELDPTRRAEIIDDLQREMLDFAAFVPLHTFPIAFAAQSYVRGFTITRAFTVSNAHRLDHVWLDI